MAVRWVLKSDPQGRLATQALRCTDQTVPPEQSIQWFGRRWPMETGALRAGFEEARRPRGVATQRQWTDKAIRRMPPVVLGLFSLVTLLAHPHLTQHDPPIRQAAWYRKRTPTFADALALVRQESRVHESFRMSGDVRRAGESPVCPPRTLDGDTLLRRLIGGSRAYAVGASGAKKCDIRADIRGENYCRRGSSVLRSALRARSRHLRTVAAVTGLLPVRESKSAISSAV